MQKFHATTILTVEKGDQVAMGGDGQVTLGDAIMKADAMKIRKLGGGKVLAGFAGSSASSCRRALSMRHCLASSVAARVRLFGESFS